MGSKPTQPRVLPPTRWSLVARAGEEKRAGRTQALSDLLDVYLPALSAHAVSGMRLAPEKTEDLVQSFVADKILERNVLGKADAHRGRFRSFLLKTFHNYVVSELRKEQAQRRHPSGSAIVRLEDLPREPASAHGADSAFNVAWAQQVLAETLDRMQAECRVNARLAVWQLFECRFLDPTLDGGVPPAYGELLDRFGFKSPSQASNVLITAKRMFRRILVDVVSDTLEENDNVDAEIAELLHILARA